MHFVLYKEIKCMLSFLLRTQGGKLPYVLHQWCYTVTLHTFSIWLYKFLPSSLHVYRTSIPRLPLWIHPYYIFPMYMIWYYYLLNCLLFLNKGYKTYNRRHTKPLNKNTIFLIYFLYISDAHCIVHIMYTNNKIILSYNKALVCRALSVGPKYNR